MEFDEWEPVYDALMADLGFDQSGDERARDELAALLADDGTYSVPTRKQGLPSVAVAGAGPSLEDELHVVRNAGAVFAASTAAERLAECDVSVDCVVTDLDKHAEHVPEYTHEGVPVAVHAHADNRELVREYVPDCDPAFLIPTTQAEPAGPVRNFGGFTDGDRAAFLADHLDADSLRFPGWDFEDPSLDPMKARKLDWAERLLYWLERRRGERFRILDGRREQIDTTDLPIDHADCHVDSNADSYVDSNADSHVGNHAGEEDDGDVEP